MEDKFILKSKVYFNNKSLKYLAKITGTRAFIVTDSVIEKLGYLQITKDYLKDAGIDSSVFTEVKPDPDMTVIASGLQMFLESGADVLVAIGGGSAIDTAKGILYFAWQMGLKAGQEMKRPTFVAIPSTSGTGSEVTNFSVITAKGEKICIVDEYIGPDIAILDSTCIQHVPQRVAADTGIDVLVHALEAYVSVDATDFTDALAEKSIQLIFENLETIYKDIDNSDARDRVLNASCMAGMAFTNSGLGINHSLAHALGASFKLPHGRSNGLMFGPVIEYNADLQGGAGNYAAARYAKLAAMLQLPARTHREGVVSLLDAITKLKRAIGIEENIHAMGIDEATFHQTLDQMAESAMADRCTPTNPKQPTKEELISIYKKAYR